MLFPAAPPGGSGLTPAWPCLAHLKTAPVMGKVTGIAKVILLEVGSLHLYGDSQPGQMGYSSWEGGIENLAGLGAAGKPHGQPSALARLATGDFRNQGSPGFSGPVRSPCTGQCASRRTVESFGLQEVLGGKASIPTPGPGDPWPPLPLSLSLLQAGSGQKWRWGPSLADPGS